MDLHAEDRRGTCGGLIAGASEAGIRRIVDARMATCSHYHGQHRRPLITDALNNEANPYMTSKACHHQRGESTLLGIIVVCSASMVVKQ